MVVVEKRQDEQLNKMVRPERFELPTCCSGGNRSIQLSYGRVRSVYMGGREGSNAFEFPLTPFEVEMPILTPQRARR